MADETTKDEKLDYTSRAEETDFISLAEDDEFKKDLVRFFSGGRYQMSPDEMRKKGFEGLTKDFIEHMRGQSWNEVTAMKDYNYVLNKDMNDQGKQAFGRLMKAWDTSQAAGTGYFDGTGDFAEAILTAPSTYVGLGSFGLGKIGSKIASKGPQVLLRRNLADMMKKNVMSNSMARSVASSAAVGATTGAIESGATSALQGETREKVIGGYEYGTKDLIADAAIGGAFGGVLGGVSGAIGGKRQKVLDEVLTERKKVFDKEAEEAAKRSLGTIGKADPKLKEEALKVVEDLDDILSAREGVKGAKLKDRLDPDRVAKGKAILAAMSDPKAAPEFESGLSVATMRSIAAASVDIMSELGIKDSERISQTVADRLRGGDIGNFTQKLTDIRKKYGLSKDEFSLIYLAEASRAGQILGFQSAIKRGAKLSEMNDINVLFSKGASSLADEDMKRISANALRNSDGSSGTVNFLRDLDAMRISFMTSQPATTMRNMRNAGILLTTDMVDEVNKALYKGVFKGDTKAIKDFLPNMTAMLRGYTFNNAEAKIVRNLMLEEMPEQSQRLYNHAMRIDVALEGNSTLAKAGRFVNLFNTASDSVLKEGMFYGSLDRQFRDQGLDMGKWLRSNKKLEDLPPGISVEKAIEAANRLTMQRDFRGDTSVTGQLTKGLSNLNRKLPFVVSGAAGIPFPRYLGNHLNMVAEYTPLVGELKSVFSVSEDKATRIARQMTGLYILTAGYTLADMRNGEVDYGSIKNELGAQEDMKPYMGATLFYLWAGDRAWRSKEGLPVTEGEALVQELKDVLGGIPDFSFDLGIIEGLAEVAMTGEVSEDFEKSLGGFLSTFTMPAAIARDVVGQMSYDQAGAPFTRDLAITDGVSTKAAGGLGMDLLKMQTTRMLPDMDFMQYTQSFNGENDIDYYRFSNPVAIGKMNPLIKQITGSVSEPPVTQLEMEMNRYNLKDWKMYNSRTVPNANVDYVVRQRLAKTMYRDFAEWKANAPAGRAYPNMTYDDIQDNDDKAQLLEGWIKKRIKQETELVEGMLDKFIAANPYKARGYVRNNYALKRKELGSDVFDKAAKDLGYESADEYIADSESVTQEISRRMSILMKTANYIKVEPY